MGVVAAWGALALGILAGIMEHRIEKQTNQRKEASAASQRRRVD